MKGMMKMKRMKKYLSLLLALAMTLASLPAFAEGEPGEGPAAVRLDPKELVVGSPTALKGDFFTEMFGNDTADIDVRALLHGYNIIRWDENQGVYLFDESVVRDTLVSTDQLGNKTYYIAFYDDLCYSDGSPITAWDYAFSLLLMMSPEIEEIGGKIYRAEHILGWSAYVSGTTDYLAGVHVLDDYQLSITLDHNFLPFFYELGLLLCCPYPIQAIAPGCKVYDDGEGVYIGNADAGAAEPVYTADLLRKTILDPETGYNSHPAVVSGPYTLVSFDGVTAHFERNPYFIGVPKKYLETGREPNGITVTQGHTVMDGNRLTRPELVKPTIEKIAFTLADYDTLVDDLTSGRIDLANKVVHGETIKDAMRANLIGDDYPRVGLSMLTFTFERPAVHDKEVRQAIAYCMDRDALTRAYCGDYGVRVDGYYGIEQWEYLVATHKTDHGYNFADEEKYEKGSHYTGVDLHTEGDYKDHSDTEEDRWEKLNLDKLTVYRVDTDRANKLLDEAGWTLNEAGGTYEPGVDAVRCKMVDGELVKLDLTMMYPEGNRIADTLQENFIDNLNKVGIRLTLVPAPMTDLFRSYYREADRTTDMIYLATNFHVILDPSITFSTDASEGHKMWNNTFSDDEDLYWRAVNMRQTDPRDIYDYVAKWISFQERYNVVLPAIPVYSNIYYDFYTPRLQNYWVTAHTTWSQAILVATFTGVTP